MPTPGTKPLRRILFQELLVVFTVVMAVAILLVFLVGRRMLEDRAVAMGHEQVRRVEDGIRGSFARIETMGLQILDWRQRGVLSELRQSDGWSVLQPLTREIPWLMSLFVVDAQGRALDLSRHEGPETPNVQDWVWGSDLLIPENGGSRFEIQFLGPDGLPNGQRDSYWKPYNPLRRPFWQEAQQHYAPFWTAPYRFGNGLPGLSLVLPRRGPEGAMVGAVALNLRLDDLSRQLGAILPTAGTQAFLVTADGRVLARTDRSPDQLARNYAKHLLVPLASDADPLLRALGQAALDPGKRALQLSRTHAGQIHPLGQVAGLDLKLLLVIPRSELLGNTPWLIGGSFAALLGLAALALLLMRFIARRTASITEALIEASGRIGSGQALELPRTRIREVEALGAALLQADQTAHARVRLEQEKLHAQRLNLVQQVASGTFHDARNALQAIQGYCDIAQVSFGQPSKLAGALDHIQTSAQRCGLILSSFTALSRKQSAPMEPVPVDALLAGVAAMSQGALSESIRLDLDVPQPAPQVMGSLIELEQALLNLILNARDALPTGGCITLQARWTETRCTLSVADDGCGMEPAVLERLFEPFFTTKGEGRGTGLGLPCVKAIVERHQGNLEVTSTPGEGSCFRIELPLA